jgi:NAD(P)-dependent dehydrogenase (short-subunit alcohol dehydrogenase family)
VSAPTGRRVAVVTGASGGVGRGIALACGQGGWEVWIAARRSAEGRAVAEEVTAVGGVGRFVTCDVADAASVATALDHVTTTAGRLDGVVHNATSGLSPKPTPLAEATLDELEDHLAVAVRGLYLLARAAWPPLRAAGGSFVVTTSEAGFEGKKLLAAYATVKAAQRGLVRSLAREWGPHGVRINAIAPVAMTPAMEAAFAAEPAMEARVRSRIPLGRIGDPVDDVGATVRFLLGDDARYVTGQTLMVDGGSRPIA